MPFRRAVPASEAPAPPPAAQPDAAEMILAALDDERVITAVAEIVRETILRDAPARPATRTPPQRKGPARG